MSRPSVRRALRRAGLTKLPRGPVVEGQRPERVLLAGETDPSVFLDVERTFGRAAPLELEIGTGKGRFLLASASQHPDRLYLGAEIQPEYGRIAQAKAEKRGLTNVRVEWLDGKDFVAQRLAPGSLAALHVYFPDPWPKQRHHKRRLVDAGFAAAAGRALAPDGLLRVASDHPEYWRQIETTLDAEPLLERLTPEQAGEWYTGTDYELRFLRIGKPIGKAVWRRKG